MSAKSVASALVAAIPDEEDASFVAQVGDRGRVTSRAGSVEVDPEPLTAAAIDWLNASIFPPDQLRTLQQTGRVQFYFALPGVDGWFSAVAGSHRDDRWLEIRRRKTAGPPPVRPATEAAAVPPASQAAPATPGTTGVDDDLLDLAGLEFPSKNVDADALSFSEDLFGMPEAERPARDGRVDSEDRSRAVVYPQQARRPRRIAIPAVACAAIAMLGMIYLGVPQAAPSAVVIVPPQAAPPAPPSVRPATPPPATTTSPPVETTASSAPAETVRPAEQQRNGFSVQIAAVETRDDAERMVTRFVTRGYSAYIARGEGAAANYFRVRIGAFPDRKTAEDVVRQLEGIEGIKPWIASSGRSSPR